MSPVVRIPDEIYSRLEDHAIGFDTPSSVIQRLLDHYEGTNPKTKSKAPKLNGEKPELLFFPADEHEFLKRLVAEQRAWVNIHHEDGTIETESWNANRISRDSNLRGNIWSGRLRGWKKKGIVKAEFYFDPKDIQG